MSTDARLRAVVFDLDGTLAASKEPLDPLMGERLDDLLRRVEVAIVTGGRFELIEWQVLQRLETDGPLLRHLHLLPACGTRYYRCVDGSWERQYAEDLTVAEKQEIGTVLVDVATGLGLYETTTWGPVLDDRGGQLTYSVLGQQAPSAAKEAWDPDGVKKESIRVLAADLLPGFSVRSGRSSSIDVTRPGIDKAYGVQKFLDACGFVQDDIVFVGDRLEPGGNDEPVALMGVRCEAVASWRETADYVGRMLPRLPLRSTP